MFKVFMSQVPGTGYSSSGYEVPGFRVLRFLDSHILELNPFSNAQRKGKIEVVLKIPMLSYTQAIASVLFVRCELRSLRGRLKTKFKHTNAFLNVVSSPLNCL